MIFLAVIGARVLFAIPQEVGANWVFQLTEGKRRRGYLDGAVDAVWSVGALPVVLAATPLMWHGWGPRIALTHAAVCLLLGAFLAEVATISLNKIPFTCTYWPGKGNVRKWWPAYLFAFTTFSFTTASVEQAAWQRRFTTFLFMACLLASWLAVRFWRQRRASRLEGFVYEEEPDDLVVTIDLGHVVGAPQKPG
jgi:hypothetical protein